LSSCASEAEQIMPGAWQTRVYFPMLKGKRVAVVANNTSLIKRAHLVDSMKREGILIKKIFSPEHGFRGESGAGEKIVNGIDVKTGIPVISLYGNHMKPTVDDLRDIDVVVFDIQDVGVRFYTYISTLQYVMESCAAFKKQLIVLDRPNPNGFYIDGPVLNKKYSSFIGLQPVPVVYGMTIGEYAMMLNGERWLGNRKKCNLNVIPCKYYTHYYRYNLPVDPSPNLTDMDAIYLYPSVCFFEGTRVSLGRGTNLPFKIIGYPGFEKGDTTFKPVDIAGKSINPPYEDTLCKGKKLSGEGLKISEQGGRIELAWLVELYNSYPSKENFFTPFFEKLAGNSKLRKDITEGKSTEKIRDEWQKDIDEFKKIRKKYLLYPDFE
jgi:uncharacterized protein YbbC (DUF1343 family)